MAERNRNPNRVRWFALALILVGFGGIAVDVAKRKNGIGESIFGLQGAWGIVGLSLMGIAAVSWLFVYATCRCPFCHKWIPPWYYPRRGFHCPKCGKTRH